jgi:hypothetical protein
MHHHVSPDYTAVAHVLGAPTITARTAQHLRDGTPDFGGLLVEAETMSGGEALLVLVARDLWAAERTVGVVDLVRRLDAGSFSRVVEAMRIARGEAGWAHELAA